ncbi:MAG: formylglycine-generating enzyme family protein [Thermoguttaceae bacterium]
MKAAQAYYLSLHMVLAVSLATGCGRQDASLPSDQGRQSHGHGSTPQDARNAGEAVETPSSTCPLPPVLALDLGGRIKMDLLLIPSGSFLMGGAGGEDDAKPVHEVTIGEPFYIGKYKVTQEQWQAVMGSNPSEFKGPRNPVDSVGWEDCRRFLKKLNEKFADASVRFSIPTEAQWEYACRAGSKAKYCYGNAEASLAEFAWFYDNSGEKTHPVGGKKPNAWGLYDMHGNLFEWCADWYSGDYYKSSPARDPCGPASGTLHVDRGGCWNSVARGCCSAFRNTNSPRPDHLIGLRVVANCAGSTPKPSPEKPR